MFSQRIDELQKWDANFVSLSPIFEPLKPWAEKFAGFENWPGLDDYQAVLDSLPSPIRTLAGKQIKIVPQAGKPGHFSEHYAPRIYLSGEIQTRTHNWHDFFQFLSWLMFPRSKAVINSIHIPAAQKRIENNIDLGKRSPIENMLSLFDEGGAVILSSDENLLEMVREFRWKELFWQQRDMLAEKFSLLTYGHALYEKGLAPYVGMTANTILFQVDQSLLDQGKPQQLAWVDAQLAAIFQAGEPYCKPRDLSPFPVLGLPGWDKNNEIETYYDNTDYFRPGRGKNVRK